MSIKEAGAPTGILKNRHPCITSWCFSHVYFPKAYIQGFVYKRQATNLSRVDVSPEEWIWQKLQTVLFLFKLVKKQSQAIY